MPERFSALQIDGLPVRHWRHQPVGRNLRLYHLPSDPAGSGFRFAAVEFVTCDVDEPCDGSDVFEAPEAGVDVLFRGIAHFDGVRQLWVGPEAGGERGYLSYPPIAWLAELFQLLRQLELQHCSSPH